MRHPSLFDRMFSNSRRGKRQVAARQFATRSFATGPRSLRHAGLEALEARNMLAIITVNGAGGADFTTIGAAIAAASNHDTIQVAAGTYNENLTIGATLTSLTIEGAGSGNTAADTIIDAGGGVGIDIQASGASAGDRLTIEGLHSADPQPAATP